MMSLWFCFLTDENENDFGDNPDDDATSIFAVAPSVINGSVVPSVPRTELNLDVGNDEDWGLMPPPPAPKKISKVVDNEEEDWGAEKSVVSGATPVISASVAASTVASQRRDSSDLNEDMGSTIRNINCYNSLSDKEKKHADKYRNLVETKIRRVIIFIRQDLYEVPFIYFYRKEVILPELEYSDLWAIYELDEKFCRLYDRKQQLVRLFQNMQAYQDYLEFGENENMDPDELRFLSNDDVRHVECAKSIQEVQDLNSFFSLYYGQDIPKMNKMLKHKAKEIRRAVQLEDMGRSEEEIALHDAESEDDEAENKHSKARLSVCGMGSYRTCKKQGIGKVVRLFGLKAEEFGENMEDGYAKHEVEPCDEDVMEVAKKCISSSS